MGATNTNSTGRSFFKLKESELPEHKKEMRFFKQVKGEAGWGDGESFNSLSGIVTSVKTKEYEWQGEKKKNLVVELTDGDEVMEFSLGMRAMTAQSILNTLAGGNGWELAFNCGKVNDKGYATLYVNKTTGLNNEENRTNWKYKVDELPKVTTTTDDEGNKIKKGQRAADLFWEGVVEEVAEKLKGLDMTPAPQKTSDAKAKAVKDAEESNGTPQEDDGLPF
jgi:hypothetical protein